MPSAETTSCMHFPPATQLSPHLQDFRDTFDAYLHPLRKLLFVFAALSFPPPFTLRSCPMPSFHYCPPSANMQPGLSAKNLSHIASTTPATRNSYSYSFLPPSVPPGPTSHPRISLARPPSDILGSSPSCLGHLRPLLRPPCLSSSTTLRYSTVSGAAKHIYHDCAYHWFRPLLDIYRAIRALKGNTPSTPDKRVAISDNSIPKARGPPTAPSRNNRTTRALESNTPSTPDRRTGTPNGSAPKARSPAPCTLRRQFHDPLRLP